jgi:hypothetical protein
MIGAWRLKSQRSVWPPSVVAGAVLGEDPPEVSLAEDQHAVGEFGSGGQHESFGEAARSRTARRDLQGVDFNEAVAMSVEEEISMCFAGSTQPTWDGRF